MCMVASQDKSLFTRYQKNRDMFKRSPCILFTCFQVDQLNTSTYEMMSDTLKEKIRYSVTSGIWPCFSGTWYWSSVQCTRVQKPTLDKLLFTGYQKNTTMFYWSPCNLKKHKTRTNKFHRSRGKMSSAYKRIFKLKIKQQHVQTFGRLDRVTYRRVPPLKKNALIWTFCVLMNILNICNQMS